MRSSAALRFAGVLAGLILLAPVTGCQSAKERIGAAAAKVRDESHAAYLELQEAIDTGDIGPKALPLVQSAMARQEIITTQAAAITDQLPNVKDVVPLWRRILGLAIDLAVAAAIAAVLIWTGLGPVFLALAGRGVRWVIAAAGKVFHPHALHDLARSLRSDAAAHSPAWVKGGGEV
jgi:hypothetical protein